MRQIDNASSKQTKMMSKACMEMTNDIISTTDTHLITMRGK